MDWGQNSWRLYMKCKNTIFEREFSDIFYDESEASPFKLKMKTFCDAFNVNHILTYQLY